MSVLDCSMLVERIVERIRALGSRHLSYVGILTLIKSVLANLHSYWARIFIIPKTILKRIDDICRNFLWKGTSHYMNAPLIAWDQGRPWATVQASPSATWAWKLICKVRDIVLPGFQGDWWLQPGTHYSVKMGYEWLRHDGVKVSWQHLVWDRFCLWLPTRARMARFGYNGDVHCCLCAGAVETSTHLFFECTYSLLCVQYISNRLGICIPNVDTWNWWLKHRFKSLFLKKVVGAAIIALVYYVWKARNHSLHNHVIVRPEVWMKPSVSDLIYRCKTQINMGVRASFESWLSTLS
ncbi:hypothetical protein RND81_09G065600 [Saponaria officinalis]|uniref:Reverse transcriptase zinc-binding domain-containing protein n=1 Tax=Saponaria officinalis TaxID=3572 RepID=A0AAW1IJI4_SAPOF